MQWSKKLVYLIDILYIKKIDQDWFPHFVSYSRTIVAWLILTHFICIITMVNTNICLVTPKADPWKQGSFVMNIHFFTFNCRRYEQPDVDISLHWCPRWQRFEAFFSLYNYWFTNWERFHIFDGKHIDQQRRHWQQQNGVVKNTCFTHGSISKLYCLKTLVLQQVINN